MASPKKALITGITGQDGSYLAELLLGKGYTVHGIVRRSSSFNTDRIEHLYRDPHDPQARLFLHYGDLIDGTGLREILTRVQPDEVYNLGAQSHVRVSFDGPEVRGQKSPVLHLVLQNAGAAGPRKVQIDYLAPGLSWKGDYSVLLGPPGAGGTRDHV